jgi:Sulfotransferase domain
MRRLDFIIIGAQKAGTTTLWQLLRHHPSISMPASKEEPFFCGDEPRGRDAFAEFMATRFASARDGAVLGKATPQYMSGTEHADAGEIAGRIASTLPEVRLIALLRDPIERALSHYRMSVRRGWEERSPDLALTEQLDAAALSVARRRPNETNSYVAQGEYGRVLREYRAHFPAEQVHVELTAELDRDPGGVLDRALAFLSLPSGFRPERLDARLHRGGTRPLLDAESKASLLEFMQENVWPNLGEERERVRRLFKAFLTIWDIAPEEQPPQLSRAVRARLEAHYQKDVAALAELGYPAPWLDS